MVVLFNAKNSILISATISSVKIYDKRDRLLIEKKDVNASETKVNVGKIDQVLMIQVTTNE